MRCCSLRAGGSTFAGSPLRIRALLRALAMRLQHERRPNVAQEVRCCWAMSAAVGAAVRRAWRDVARGCRAIFRVAAAPAGRRSGDIVTADFF
ncbi:hypothetical protein F511_45393 [Dorcoceras hygrometricum]|uniref:Uncharacterized protein n=1 Tax=Dorcoceras hygrometricum TaxID=472368 RepID=A0A2Z7A3U0_9LAMI|nr:hypothetical protein F511_45393 [Dorcoceras hygrometricum]